METGTIPPNWENLFKYSSEMATAQDIDLADTCLQVKCNKRALDQILGPFIVVTHHHKRQKINASGSTSNNKDIPISVSEGDKSHESSSPTSQPMNQSAANSFANYRSKSNNVRYGFQIDTFNSNPYRNPLSHIVFTICTAATSPDQYKIDLRRSLMKKSIPLTVEQLEGAVVCKTTLVLFHMNRFRVRIPGEVNYLYYLRYLQIHYYKH